MFNFFMRQHIQHYWLMDVLVKYNHKTIVDFCPFISHLLKSLYHQQLSYVSLLTSTKCGNVLNCVKLRRVIASRSSVDLCAHRRSERLDNQSRADREDFIEFALHAFISTACRNERYVFWLVLHGTVSFPHLRESTSLVHLSNKWVMSSGDDENSP